VAWFKRKERSRAAARSSSPKACWIKCDSCKEIIYRAEVERGGGRVCPKCHYPFRISARERIASSPMPARSRSGRTGLATTDPLSFKDTKRYARARPRPPPRRPRPTRRSSVASRRSAGSRRYSAVFEFGFLGGSMARSSARSSRARSSSPSDKHLPVVIVSASGGARMQEGILSLMQMAKTSAALERLGARRAYRTSRSSPILRPAASQRASRCSAHVILAEARAPLIGFAARGSSPRRSVSRCPKDSSARVLLCAARTARHDRRAARLKDTPSRRVLAFLRRRAAPIGLARS